MLLIFSFIPGHSIYYRGTHRSYWILIQAKRTRYLSFVFNMIWFLSAGNRRNSSDMLHRSCNFVHQLYRDKCRATSITPRVIINYETYTIKVSLAKWYHPRLNYPKEITCLIVQCWLMSVRHNFLLIDRQTIAEGRIEHNTIYRDPRLAIF